jgi:hypothetical protein
MNITERKARFTEIMTTIELAPDEISGVEEAEALVFPNLTEGLSDFALKDALLAQTFRESEDFKVKFVSIMANTAMKSIMDKVKDDREPNDDDLYAFAITANVLWAEGQASHLFKVLGMISHTCQSFDLDIPELATVLLRPQDKASEFGKFSPMRLLEGDITIEEVLNNL